MSEEKKESPEEEFSTKDLIEKLKPLVELAKLKRDLAVYRLETIKADMQYKQLKNPPQPNGDKRESDKTPN